MIANGNLNTMHTLHSAVVIVVVVGCNAVMHDTAEKITTTFGVFLFIHCSLHFLFLCRVVCDDICNETILFCFVSSSCSNDNNNTIILLKSDFNRGQS